ncbi:MAG: lipid-A-disaccharide synthase [Phycisphaerae bacterium]
MSNASPTIFLSAAEASGDEHAAHLIRALRDHLPNARFVGVAGEKMAEAGCEALADLTTSAEMLTGPLLRIGYWIKTVRRIQRQIAEIAPDVHIPVDSPALNWHLASAARQAGAKVFYYIAPQVWAWAPWRVKKLARLTDHVGCILPFEQDFLRQRGVKATFVGNPLFDALPPRPNPLPDLTEPWYEGTWQVALAPGSRKSEIRGHARPLLAVSHAIMRRWSHARCTFTARTAEDADLIRKYCGTDQVEIEIGRTREMLAQSHFAVACSGTVTLQAAHFGVPAVVFYRTGWLLGLLHRTLGRFPKLVRTRYLSLVNILAGRRVVPELMPWRGNVRHLTDVVLEVMDDLGYLFEMRREMLRVVAPLRVPEPGSASDNAARLVAQIVRGEDPQLPPGRSPLA